MVRARSAVVASLLAAGVVLAGCGGPQEPKPLEGQQNAQDNAPDDAGGDQGDDSGDEGPSNGDDSTPSDGQGDDGQRVEQNEGDWTPVDGATEAELKKAALRFTDEYHRMVATGDSAKVKKLYTDECSQCRQAVAGIEKVYQRGGHYEGGEVLDPKAEVRGREDSGRVEVLLIGKSAAYKAVDSSGNVLESEPQQQDNQTFWFREGEGSWKIVWWA